MQSIEKKMKSNNIASVEQSEEDIAFLAALEGSAPQNCPETPEDVDQFCRDNINLLRSVVRPYRGLDEIGRAHV